MSTAKRVVSGLVCWMLMGCQCSDDGLGSSPSPTSSAAASPGEGPAIPVPDADLEDLFRGVAPPGVALAPAIDVGGLSLRPPTGWARVSNTRGRAQFESPTRDALLAVMSGTRDELSAAQVLPWVRSVAPARIFWEEPEPTRVGRELLPATVTTGDSRWRSGEEAARFWLLRLDRPDQQLLVVVAGCLDSARGKRLPELVASVRSLTRAQP